MADQSASKDAAVSLPFMEVDSLNRQIESYNKRRERQMKKEHVPTAFCWWKVKEPGQVWVKVYEKDLENQRQYLRLSLIFYVRLKELKLSLSGAIARRDSLVASEEGKILGIFRWIRDSLLEAARNDNVKVRKLGQLTAGLVDKDIGAFRKQEVCTICASLEPLQKLIDEAASTDVVVREQRLSELDTSTLHLLQDINVGESAQDSSVSDKGLSLEEWDLQMLQLAKREYNTKVHHLMSMFSIPEELRQRPKEDLDACIERLQINMSLIVNLITLNMMFRARLMGKDGAEETEDEYDDNLDKLDDGVHMGLSELTRLLKKMLALEHEPLLKLCREIAEEVDDRTKDARDHGFDCLELIPLLPARTT